MLLLGSANPSFVLLKEPLSFHYHMEIEFIYCQGEYAAVMYVGY